MKLILCKKCQDVIRLQTDIRKCKCGNCGGRYFGDGTNAEYWGDQVIPLGFANTSLAHAIQTRPVSGNGQIFTAFVIPEKCLTMKKVAKPDEEGVPPVD